MIKAPQQQIPGVYHRRVGDIVVTAISDGFVDGAVESMRNISAEHARRILTESFRPARRTPINAFLIYSAGRLALMDPDRATTSSRPPARSWPTSGRQGSIPRRSKP